MAELKPCPFCGSTAEIRFISNGTRSGGVNGFVRCFRIWCPNCGCTNAHDFEVTFDYSPYTGLRVDESNLLKAAETWNRRVNNE